MSERQRHMIREQRTRPTAGGQGDDSGTDADFDQMRAEADRLLSIVDRSYDHIRSENSEEHLLHNRQRGGQ